MGATANDVYRNRQLVRTWNLLVALRRRAWTLHMLAVKFRCSTRTIRRDLYALQAAGFPVYDVRGDAISDPVYWKIGPMTEWPRGEETPTQEWKAS